MGSVETVPLIKIVDLKQFQAQRFAKDNLQSVVGDLTADVLGKLRLALALLETASLEARYHGYCEPHRCDRQTHSPECNPLWQAGIKRNDPDFLPPIL